MDAKTPLELDQLPLDPIPRYLLHLDLLRSPEVELSALRQQLDESRWVGQLASAQWADGSWGRFHTQDTKRKQPIPTTETAILLALGAGLWKDHPVLARTVAYIERVLDGQVDWRDWHEKHDNPDAWPWSVKHISAANLAMIDPKHALLEPHRAFWVAMADAAFGSGTHDRTAEVSAFNEATGYGLKSPPTVVHRYPLILLSTSAGTLEPALAQRIGEEVLAKWPPPPEQLLSACPSSPEASRLLYGWLQAMAPARGLDPVDEAVRRVVQQFQCTQDGWYDLGTKLPRRPHSDFPLSESWRRKPNRQIDSTIWIQRQTAYKRQPADCA